MFGRYNSVLHGSPARWDYDRLKHKKGGADAPDYSQLAAASEKAAVLGKELGDAQLAENKRQYENNMRVADPVIQAQLGLMNQQQTQGDNYYNYNLQYGRPVEQQLYYEAMGFSPEEVNQITNLRTSAVNTAEEKVQTQYDADMAKYNADVNAASAKSYFLDANGNAIQSGDISKVLAPQKVAGTTTASGGQYGWLGNGFMGNNNVTYQTTYSKEEQDILDKQNAGYYQVETKDGKTVWVKSGDANANPAANSIVKPAKGLAEADYTELEAQTAALAAGAKARQDAKDLAERNGILTKSNDLESRLGETDRQVYDRYAGDIEAEAGQAVADSRAGFTNSINNAARQGLRYGFSPAKLAAMASGQSVQQAGVQAGAANRTRKAAVETMYGRGVNAAQQGLTGLTTNRNLKIQDNAIATAKKQDVAGLYRNLPSASQGSYNLATNAGNSAVGNQNTTSNQYMQGVNQGNNIIMDGQKTQVSGLGQMVGAQTSFANANSGDSGLWGALGTVGGAYASTLSDRRVKKNIKPIDEDKALAGIKKTRISKWKYDPSKVKDGELVDDKAHIGAMAQDLKKNLGGQVSNGRMVDLISAVGVTMAATKALAKKVDQLAKDEK